MMNVLYMDFNLAGEIIRWGAWQVESADALPAIAPSCQRAIFDIEPGETYDLSNCYIDLSVTPVKLKNLRSFGVVNQVDLTIGQTVDISGLPEDTTAHLGDEVYAITGGTLSLEGEMEASYGIRLEAPTYKSHIIQVEVKDAA